MVDGAWESIVIHFLFPLSRFRVYNRRALLYFLYPQIRKLSGAERLILKLADYITRAGESVTLVTHRFAAECRPALGAHVKLIETKASQASLAPFSQHYLDAPFEYTASLRLLPHIGKDARALTFFGPPSLPALWWSRARGARKIPHLYFCYEPPRFAYSDTNEVSARLGRSGALARWMFPAYRLLDRALAKRADVLLANSAFGADLIFRAYHRSATVITHGADFGEPNPTHVEELRARYELKGKRILLTVNFLHPRKRLDLFLATLSRVREKIPNVVGLVVGAGPERERLEALAAELNLRANVRFTGFVPDDDLPAHYALAEVYVNSAKLESFGLSVLEASASALPVVSVNEGGPCEIIADNETGFLTAAMPDALAEKIVLLLWDDSRRIKMGNAARERVTTRYRWEDGARIFLDVVNGETSAHSNAPLQKM